MEEEPDTLDVLQFRRTGPAVATLLLLFVVLPVLVGLVSGSSPLATIGFEFSVLLLQGLSPTVGIGIGLPVVNLILIDLFVAAGVIIVVFRICDLFADRSERDTRWIGKVQKTMERYRILNRYGEYMLIPIMWVPGIGLYGTPVVAWVLWWRGMRAVALMLTGWLIACLTVVGVTEGILAFFGHIA